MTDHDAMTILIPLVCIFLTAMLSIIAFFLVRLIKQIDNLATQFATLNTTMLKIDADLSGDMGILKSEHQTLKLKVDEFDPVWDRLRLIEQGLVTIQTKCSKTK